MRKPYNIPTALVLYFNSMIYKGLDMVSRRGLIRTRCQI